MKLTPKKVKDASLKKWSPEVLEGIKTLDDAQEWWDNCGSAPCSFCTHFDCGDCPLSTHEDDCADEWEKLSVMIDGDSNFTLERFRRLFLALHDRIEAVKTRGMKKAAV